jgi:NADH-quinone oxidoreductase subunit L
MRKMGGLRRYLPRTWLAFVIGALALSGLPPFAGFFSKDSILAATLAAGTYGQILYVVALVGVFLTAFYAFRMVFLVFGGEPSPYVREHFHAPGRGVGPLSMGIAVAVLALLSVVGGWIQFAIFWKPVETWMEPVARSLVEPSTVQDVGTSVLAAVVSIAGIALAWAMYSARVVAVPQVPSLRALLEHKFYFDELYDALFYKPAVLLARGLRDFVEGPFILGSLTGIAIGARRLAGEVTELQTGLVRTYALTIAGGVTILALVFVWVK